MTVAITTDATFAEDVLASALPVLVEFTADWCPPCKMIAPILEQISTDEAGRLTVVSLDVDENPAITARYGVMSMPTLTLFVGGQVVSQTVGAKPRAMIMRDLEPHLSTATV